MFGPAAKAANMTLDRRGLETGVESVVSDRAKATIGSSSRGRRVQLDGFEDVAHLI